MKLPLEEKENKPVQARGFSLVLIIELLGSVLRPPETPGGLVKHHTSVPHLDISKVDREAIKLRGGCQPALVISRWRKECPKIPTSQQYLECFLCRSISKIGVQLPALSLHHIMSPIPVTGSTELEWQGHRECHL